jgi:hypothetical protein
MSEQICTGINQLYLLTLLLLTSLALMMKLLGLFATQLRAINADLRYNSQLSLFDISITEKMESLDYF